METPSLKVLWRMRVEKKGGLVWASVAAFLFLQCLPDKRHEPNNTNGFYVTAIRKEKEKLSWQYCVHLKILEPVAYFLTVFSVRKDESAVQRSKSSCIHLSSFTYVQTKTNTVHRNPENNKQSSNQTRRRNFRERLWLKFCVRFLRSLAEINGGSFSEDYSTSFTQKCRHWTLLHTASFKKLRRF